MQHSSKFSLSVLKNCHKRVGTLLESLPNVLSKMSEKRKFAIIILEILLFQGRLLLLTDRMLGTDIVTWMLSLSCVKVLNPFFSKNSICRLKNIKKELKSICEENEFG